MGCVKTLPEGLSGPLKNFKTLKKKNFNFELGSK